MNTIHDDQNEVLNQVVEPLRSTPERNPHRAAQGKRAFLTQAHVMAKEIENRNTDTAVSIPVPRRLKGWIEANF
ncbi:MAG: hypothetical protein PVF85_11585, partial [Anaerolineales bacterium]